MSLAIADRLVLVRDAVDDADRTEELLAVGVHVGRHVGEHRRRVERAVARAARDEGRALRDRPVDLLGEPLGRRERRQRAEHGVVRERVAHLRGRHRRRELLEERVVEPVHDDEALGRVARLAVVVQARRRRRPSPSRRGRRWTAG